MSGNTSSLSSLPPTIPTNPLLGAPSGAGGVTRRMTKRFVPAVPRTSGGCSPPASSTGKCQLIAPSSSTARTTWPTSAPKSGVSRTRPSSPPAVRTSSWGSVGVIPSTWISMSCLSAMSVSRNASTKASVASSTPGALVPPGTPPWALALPLIPGAVMRYPGATCTAPLVPSSLAICLSLPVSARQRQSKVRMPVEHVGERGR